jgi:hypothetical protein
MIGSRTLTLLCLLPLAVGATERSPLRDGEYAFRHRSAEHPDLPAHPLVARISGTRIVLVNRKPSTSIPDRDRRRRRPHVACRVECSGFSAMGRRIARRKRLASAAIGRK